MLLKNRQTTDNLRIGQSHRQRSANRSYPENGLRGDQIVTGIRQRVTSSKGTSGPDPESESAELAEDTIAQVAVLLDGKGESVYSPFPDRGEPLMRPVELPQGTLEMLILKAVSLGPLHGYGILLRIQQISGERLEILQGSFYTAIYRLERRGWIRAEWGESENNRRARFYSLTAAGTRQLKAETAEWTDMAAVVAGILDKKAGEI